MTNIRERGLLVIPIRDVVSSKEYLSVISRQTGYSMSIILSCIVYLADLRLRGPIRSTDVDYFISQLLRDPDPYRALLDLVYCGMENIHKRVLFKATELSYLYTTHGLLYLSCIRVGGDDHESHRNF